MAYGAKLTLFNCHCHKSKMTESPNIVFPFNVETPSTVKLLFAVIAPFIVNVFDVESPNITFPFNVETP
jgi:hypothetical protein